MTTGHAVDVCRDRQCEPCVAQRFYEADQAARAQALAENLRTIGEAITAPARWLLARLARR